MNPTSTELKNKNLKENAELVATENLLPYIFHLKNESESEIKKIVVFDTNEDSIMLGIRSSQFDMPYKTFTQTIEAHPFKSNYLEIISEELDLPTIFPIEIETGIKSGHKTSWPFYGLVVNSNCRKKYRAFVPKHTIDQYTRYIINLPPKFSAYLMVYPLNEMFDETKPTVSAKEIKTPEAKS